MARTKAQKKEQAEAVERLRGWLKPGMTLLCTLRSVSRSGMSRCIALHWTDKDGNIYQATTNAATALNMRYDGSRDGVIVGGCGMDMGFHLVYELSRALFGGPEGWRCSGNGCGCSEHHSRPQEDKKGKPYRKGLKHAPATAGYALRHRWI